MKNKIFLKKYASFLIPFLLFAFAFISRSIKANFFPLWEDEFITARWTRLDYMLEYHHFDNNAPLAPVINLFFKQIFNNNYYAQRFPQILMGALSVLVFYQMMRHFLSRRWATLFSLITATSFILIFYSQEIRPYSYLLFFTLVTFYYGYKVVVEGDRSWGKILLLILSFALLPFTHYISWFHFISLDVALIIVILLLGTHKLQKVLQLITLNVFIILAYIPWADSVYYYILQNLTIRSNPLAKYHFSTRVFWGTIDKFSGATGLWSRFLFVICITTMAYVVLRLIKRWLKKQEISSFDKFAFMLIPYSLIFFFLITRAKYTEDIFFWRHYIFLIWPFYVLIFYGLWTLARQTIKFRFLSILTKITVVFIIGFFLISNIINTTAYLLAPHRFYDWRSIVDFIEPMIVSGQKQKVYVDNPGDLRMYVETQIPYERSRKIWQAVGQIKREQIKEISRCCAKGAIFIRISTTNEEPPGPIPGFAQMKTIGRSKYLDFLIKRGAAPYSGWYELHVIYY